MRIAVELSRYGILNPSQTLHLLHVGIVSTDSGIDARLRLELTIPQTGARRSRDLSGSAPKHEVPRRNLIGRVSHIGDERVPVDRLRAIRRCGRPRLFWDRLEVFSDDRRVKVCGLQTSCDRRRDQLAG